MFTSLLCLFLQYTCRKRPYYTVYNTYNDKILLRLDYFHRNLDNHHNAMTYVTSCRPLPKRDPFWQRKQIQLFTLPEICYKFSVTMPRNGNKALISISYFLISNSSPASNLFEAPDLMRLRKNVYKHACRKIKTNMTSLMNYEWTNIILTKL